MKPTPKFRLISQTPRLTIAIAVCLVAHVSPAAITTWTGAEGDEKWSTSENWSDGLPDGNDVVFAEEEAVGTPGWDGFPNNLVDIDTTILSLRYTNLEPGNHTTEIPPGVTLTVNGTGDAIQAQHPVVGSGHVVYATILGGGTLAVENPAAVVYVGQGSGIVNTDRRATLDLAGLETFSGTLAQLMVGRQLNSTLPNRPQGTLKLARNNTLELTANPGIYLGNINQNNGNAADAQILELGASNTFLSDSGIIIGGKKGNGYLRFNSETVDPGEGSAVFRNLAGTGRQANWLIGDNSTQPGGGLNATGLVDFSTFGTVDALVGNIIVGRATGGTVTNFNTISEGTLTFDRGTIDTNALTAGIQPGSPLPGNARGTINVDGTGKLLVNGNATLGRHTGGGQFARGILNIGTLSGGGEIEILGDVICGFNSLGNRITIRDGGTLRVGGIIGRLDGANDDILETIDLDNATLAFDLGVGTDPAVARANVDQLIATGTVDIRVTGGGLEVGTFKLIDYGSLGGDGFAAFNLLPTPGAVASLVDNSAEGSVELVVTTLTGLKWTGTPNGDWDIDTTANWLATPANTPSTYTETDGMGPRTLFDDTATGSKTVNLTTIVSPMQVVVDTAETYTFSGSGSLSGQGGLTKQGEGTLVLEGEHTYTAATTIISGTLEVRGATHGSSAIANDAALVFNSDSEQSYANPIAGAGSLAKQGTGTLILTGNNTYTGPTSIEEGVVQVGNGGTTGSLGGGANTSSDTFIAAGAVLNIERSTDNFGYNYFAALSGSGDVNVPDGRRLNLRANQEDSGDLKFTVDGLIGINTLDGVTAVRMGELHGSGQIQRAGGVGGGVTILIGDRNTNSSFPGRIVSNELGIEKTGTGTLTLGGDNVYGGATSVSEGTLALGSAGAIPNGTNVTIAPGAVFDTSARPAFAMLPTQSYTFGINAGSGATGTLAAGELDITGAVVALEIIGTPSAPAYVLASYTNLTGTAFATEPAVPAGYELRYDYQGDKIALVQTGTADGFTSWAAFNGASGQSLADDHDNDGVPNGIEYFLGGPDGDTTGFTPLPGVASSAGTLSVTWTKGPGYAGTYGTDFRVETSDTLEAASWTMETEGATVTINGDDVTYTFPSPLGARKFARLVVTGP